jgi:hypothetical protein
MELSGQLHAPAALPPGKDPLVPTGKETSWAPEPVWTWWWKDKFPAPAGIWTPNQPTNPLASTIPLNYPDSFHWLCHSKVSIQIRRHVGHFIHSWLLMGGVASPFPHSQSQGLPLVGCPRLLIQYVCSYRPYLEAISSIHNLKTWYAIVTGSHIIWKLYIHQLLFRW